MRIADVIQFIKANVPFRYYANDFPKSDESDCGFVRMEGGGQPDIYVLGLKSPSIQIALRHKKGDEAERIANEVWSLFHGKQHYTIGKTQVKFSSAEQSEPIYIGEDKNGRSIYSVNVTCKIVE